MKMTFHEKGFADYMYWQTHDGKVVKKINRLLQSIGRDGAMKGEGKPERLKYEPAYSRRIDEENRLIYDVVGDVIEIFSCKGHY